MSEYRQYPGPNQQPRHARGQAPQGAPRVAAPGANADPRAHQDARRVAAGGSSPGAYRPTGAQPGTYRPVAAQPGAYRPASGYGGSGMHNGAPSSGRGKNKNKNKGKGGPWRVVFWIALVVFVGALAALGVIGYGYWQGQQTYNQVAEQGFTPPSDLAATELADMTVDWDALKAINPDTVGWIYIPGTAVNYPIVHTTDDEKYLKTNFQGETSWVSFGTIFLAAQNASDFSDANSIVYGHHMNDGSMFAAIAAMGNSADEFNAHRSVYLLTPQGNFELSTFALLHVAADDPLAQTAFSSEEERVAYVQDKIDRSVASVSDAPAAADMKQTFTFSTCDNLPSDGRWVLYAYVAQSTVASAPKADESQAATAQEGGMADPDAVAAVNDAAKEIAS